MTYINQYQDSISTVQLSPFAEEQWNRIVTYSPIYVHWTDMIMMTQQRTNKNPSGKLNLIGKIDLNTLKLEDEILLNQLYDIRKSFAIPSKGKTINHGIKISNDEHDHQSITSTDDVDKTSDFSHEPKEPSKHHCSYAEQSFAPQQTNVKRPVVTNQNIPVNQGKRLPNVNFGSKFQPSVGVQLRQSAITREHALSATNDHRSTTPLSMASSKRTAGSAHSSHRYYHLQQYRTSQSPISNDINTNVSVHERLTGESAPPRARARSTTSSRSTMHMLKTKTERRRQKQNVELKSLLVEPWKQASLSDDILDDNIPNSLEIMQKMCGPSTPFERNLRRDYHRQLNQYRNGTTKT